MFLYIILFLLYFFIIRNIIRIVNYPLYFLSDFSLSIILSILITEISFLCLKKRQKNESIIIGVSPDYPPFAFLKNGEMCGFDIDVIKEITKSINKEITFMPLPFEALLPALEIGTISIALGGLTKHEARESIAYMSATYLDESPLALVSLKPLDVNSLQGKKVRYVMPIGYAGSSVLQQKGFNLENTTYVKSIPEALLYLYLDRGDVVATSYYAIRQENKENNFYVYPLKDCKEEYVFFINKKEKELTKKISKAITLLKKEKRYQKIKYTWLSEKEISL
jgi:ABC-type amino acid transport substrate-binding protein